MSFVTFCQLYLANFLCLLLFLTGLRHHCVCICCHLFVTEDSATNYTIYPLLCTWDNCFSFAFLLSCLPLRQIKHISTCSVFSGEKGSMIYNLWFLVDNTCKIYKIPFIRFYFSRFHFLSHYCQGYYFSLPWIPEFLLPGPGSCWGPVTLFWACWPVGSIKIQPRQLWLNHDSYECVQTRVLPLVPVFFY